MVVANGAITYRRAKTLAAQLSELGVKPEDITYVKPGFAASQKFAKLAGNHDVFGDFTVTILSTPGHTPGHQSLLVRLPKTGYIVLSGDAVHFRDNWEHERVPSRADPRVAATAAERHGRAQDAAVDQPRQAAERRPPLRARVLRVTRA